MNLSELIWGRSPVISSTMQSNSKFAISNKTFKGWSQDIYERAAHNISNGRSEVNLTNKNELDQLDI